MKTQGTEIADTQGAAMKAEEPPTGRPTFGPFLKLMLMLGERRTWLESEVFPCATAGPSLATAVNGTPGSVMSGPFHTLPLALGPFLTMILMLAERKTAEHRPSKLSSITLAGSGRSGCGGDR